MGAEVSRVVDGNDGKRRQEDDVDDANDAGQKKRRMSKGENRGGGRKERRSMLDAEIDRSSLTAFHQDIDPALPAQQRLAALFDEAFAHSVRQVGAATSGPEADKDLEHAKAAFAEWHRKVTEAGAWQSATEERQLRPNPKNTEMKATLTKYKAVRSKLQDELGAWRAVYDEELPASSPSFDLDAASAQSSAIASAATSATGAAVAPPPAAVADLPLKVEVLESFVAGCNRVLDAAEQRRVAVTTEITSRRFVAYPAMDDPRKLIAAVGKV